MTQRITLTLSDDLAERISRLASYYDKDAKTFMADMLESHTAILEAHIENHACQQIAYLTAVEPAGRA